MQLIPLCGDDKKVEKAGTKGIILTRNVYVPFTSYWIGTKCCLEYSHRSRLVVRRRQIEKKRESRKVNVGKNVYAVTDLLGFGEKCCLEEADFLPVLQAE